MVLVGWCQDGLFSTSCVGFAAGHLYLDRSLLLVLTALLASTLYLDAPVFAPV